MRSPSTARHEQLTFNKRSTTLRVTVGAPASLVSDSGGAYTSADFEAVCTRLQIRHETIVSTQGESPTARIVLALQLTGLTSLRLVTRVLGLGQLLDPSPQPVDKAHTSD